MGKQSTDEAIEAIEELKASLRRLGDQLWADRWSLGISLGIFYALLLVVAAVVYLLPW